MPYPSCFHTLSWAGGVCLLLVLVAAPVTAQQCSFDWTTHYEKMTRLTNDIDPVTGDSRSVPTWLSLSGASNDLRETWYFPRNQLAGTDVLHRLFDSSSGDYADDPNTLSGYTSDLIHGYPFDSRSRSGLTVMRRYLDTSSGDYRTWLFDETPAGYSPNETWWTSSASPRLGYQRFGNPLGHYDVLAEAYDEYPLENFFLDVDINEIWGNAVGRITHKPSGRQIVSEFIGDMVQSVVRFNAGEGCILANPTQSGGTNCYQDGYGETDKWVGSPVISATLSGNDPYTLTSVVRPFEFCSQGPTGEDWPNTDGNEPLLWKGEIERQETLGCILGQSTRRDTLKSTSRYRLASNHGSSSQSLSINNTHWLDIQSWGDAKDEDFILEWVNLSTGATTLIDYTDTNGAVKWNHVFEKRNEDHPLAVKMSLPDGSFSVAIARLDPPSVSNDVTRVMVRCDDDVQPDCDGYAQQILIVQVVRQGETLTKSYGSPLESFMFVNTSSDVDSRLSVLPGDGGNCLQ